VVYYAQYFEAIQEEIKRGGRDRIGEGKREREIDLGKVRAELVGCLERPLKPGMLRGNAFVIKVMYDF